MKAKPKKQAPKKLAALIPITGQESDDELDQLAQQLARLLAPGEDESEPATARFKPPQASPP
jgi:hypothetical protein